ncbi:phosphotransferase enzyme family protein [Paenibacillus arenosi]|uniref:Phosphotransferase n=1 Tax=Paenibacillus arenosi TaxID=2774142 RepID=A0ABR9B341_9BACL|nr:phosphotransferase [Paenibacillus arenosi]MBD8500727.1 phosphotransferase [Paenibacillus arenosi]
MESNNWSSSLLEEACRRYGGDPSSIQTLGGFTNNVFSFKRNEEPVILKLYTYKSPADHSHLVGELTWMTHLSQQRVRITKPIFSEQGLWIEEIQLDEGDFLAVVYEKAAGKLLQDQHEEAWNANLFYKIGEAMGNMHRAAAEMEPILDDSKRIKWHEEAFIHSPPLVSNEVLLQWNTYVSKLKSWPTDSNVYGLVHHDLHPHNFYVHNGELVLFDFGDCLYHWYSYDTAIILYHALQFARISDQADRDKWAVSFMESFGKGYAAAYQPLTKQQLEQIPFLLRYRRLYSYMYFKANTVWEQLDEETRTALEQMRAAIEQDKPVLDVEFSPLMQ